MILTLTRPLVTFDVETHDTVAPEIARIVEFGFNIDYPLMWEVVVDEQTCASCRALLNTYTTTAAEANERCERGMDLIKCTAHVVQPPPKRWGGFIKPDLLITPAATAVHGITNEMVADAYRFRDIASGIAKHFVDCDFCGYNVRFDLRCVAAEMQRAGYVWSQGKARIVDALRMWQVAKPRTLSDCIRENCGREPNDAHRALADADDARDAALALFSKYPDKLPTDLDELHKLCFSSNNVDPDGKFVWNPANQAVINFGKHQGTTVDKVPRDYFAYMLKKGDFAPEVLKIMRDALVGVYPVREQTEPPATEETQTL
jgi:DNA polymerase-3 subunit epsilon